MLAHETIRYRANLLKQQVERKRVRGIVLTADEIWSRIKAAHPTASEEDNEAVFQAI